MIMQIFAVKDRALDAYMRPWFAHAPGQALRAFMDEINNPQGEMFKHPDDYDLWHVGSFDDNTGQVTRLEGGPKQVAIGKNLKQNPEQN